MKIILNLIFVFFLSVKAVEFDCNFVDSYRCKVVKGKINKKDQAFVTKVTGKHKTDKNDINVTGFDARNAYLKYFPRNLSNHFPFIHEVFVEGSLLEITKEDLKQFPKLVWFYASYNAIETLEENLFLHNPNLKLVFFNGNRIKYVEPAIFDHLSELTYVGFADNDCHSGHVEDDRKKSLELIQEIKDKCNKPSYNVEQRKYVQLEAEFKKFKEENLRVIEILNTQNTILKAEKFQLASKVEQYEKIRTFYRCRPDETLSECKSNNERKFQSPIPLDEIYN